MIEQFSEAVKQYLQISPALLSIGERSTAHRWFTLSLGAQRLFLFLFHRKPKRFRREHIQYVAVDKPHYYNSIEEENLAIAELVETGFIFPVQDILRVKLYLEALRKVEVVKLCQEFNFETKGSKQDCIERLQDKPLKREEVIYQLEHRTLFQQICRQYTFSHQGDLQRMLLASLDEVPITFVPYKVTLSPLLHYTRAETFDYRRWRYSTESPSQAPLIQNLSPIRYRFSGQRFWIDNLLNSPPVEPTSEYIEALFMALKVAKTERTSLQIRLALSLLSVGNGKKGLKCIIEFYKAAETLLDRLLLAQTGRHLARRIRGQFPPLPPIMTATERRLNWRTVKRGTRQTYNDMPVEYAVLHHLNENNRTAVRTENSPWNNAFALLFLDILFAPVKDLLPSPILSAPIDFGTRDLYLNRKDLFDGRLQEIQQKGPLAILERNIQELKHPVEMLHIRGCNWNDFTYADLCTFLEHVPTQALHAILEHKLLYPKAAHRGLPDLCVLAGDPIRVQDLFPSKLPTGFFFLEVKSERDTLSPYQQHWIHVLKSAGCVVEVWNIHSKGRKNA